jgi:hypothetical protein
MAYYVDYEGILPKENYMGFYVGYPSYEVPMKKPSL